MVEKRRKKMVREKLKAEHENKHYGCGAIKGRQQNY